MPPPLVMLLVAGVGAYAGYRWLSKKGEQISKDLRRAQDDIKRRAEGKPVEKDLGRLKQDPVTGEYRPETGSSTDGHGGQS